MSKEEKKDTDIDIKIPKQPDKPIICNNYINGEVKIMYNNYIIMKKQNITNNSLCHQQPNITWTLNHHIMEVSNNF